MKRRVLQCYYNRLAKGTNAERLSMEAKHGMFPGYLAEAGEFMPDEAKEERFAFVVYRLWVLWLLDSLATWEDFLLNRYKDFVDEFDWRPADTREDIEQVRIDRTLSLFQQRYGLMCLNARHAVGMIRTVERMAAAAEGLI
jgi:hypothetical protein